MIYVCIDLFYFKALTVQVSVTSIREQCARSSTRLQATNRPCAPIALTTVPATDTWILYCVHCSLTCKTKRRCCHRQSVSTKSRRIHTTLALHSAHWSRWTGKTRWSFDAIESLMSSAWKYKYFKKIIIIYIWINQLINQSIFCFTFCGFFLPQSHDREDCQQWQSADSSAESAVAHRSAALSVRRQTCLCKTTQDESERTTCAMRNKYKKFKICFFLALFLPNAHRWHRTLQTVPHPYSSYCFHPVCHATGHTVPLF